jgi:acetyl esterase/lipase
MDRRSLIGLGALGLTGFPWRALADTSAQAPLPETIALWPAAPPGGSGAALKLDLDERSPAPATYHDRIVTGIARPTLTVFRPREPNGSAILIAPGGGYSYEAYDLEGIEPALRLAENGVTAFVLLYRLPYEGWQHRADVPLQDAQRAMRIIRSQGVREYGIDPARIGMLGFSAGGHLAASLATRFGATVYEPIDATDAFDARPNFAALLYPVITMLPPFAHDSSVGQLLGPRPSTALRTAYSPERAVTVETPPCFLCAALDDPDVPIDNSLMMLASLRAAKVPCEIHLFERGGHGFALRGAAGLPVAAWPDLLQQWGASQGYFRNVAAKP